MFTNDYIMRMIEQLVRGVAMVMRLKQENRMEESETVLTDTLRRFFGLHDRSLETLHWRQLMEVASLGGLPDGERCTLLAQLIGERADSLQLQGQAVLAAALWEKAACIYLSAVLMDDSLAVPEHTDRIDAILLRAARLHQPDTLRLLCAYHERLGRLAKAEDCLYELMEAAGDGKDVELGLDFYRRMLGKADEELLRGNLPRSEVEQGMAQLQARWGRKTNNPKNAMNRPDGLSGGR